MLKLFCTRLYSCLSSAKLKGILKKVSPACLVWLTKLMFCEQMLFSELSLQCSREKCFPISFSLFLTSHKSSNSKFSMLLGLLPMEITALCCVEEVYYTCVPFWANLITEIIFTYLETTNLCSGLLLKVYLFE